MYFLVVHVHVLHLSYTTVHLQSQKRMHVFYNLGLIFDWVLLMSTPIGKPALNVVFHIVSMNRCYSLGVQNF